MLMHFDDPMVSAVGLHPIADELRRLANSGDYSLLLRRSAELSEEARHAPERARLADDLGELAATGPVAAIAAIDVLAVVDHPLADGHFVDLLAHPDQLVRRHAAW